MLEELEDLENLEILEILENLEILVNLGSRPFFGRLATLPLEEGAYDFSLLYEEGEGDEDTHEEHIARGES